MFPSTVTVLVTGCLLLLTLSSCCCQASSDEGQNADTIKVKETFTVDSDHSVREGSCNDEEEDYINRETYRSIAEEKEQWMIIKYLFQVHVFAIGVVMGVACTLLVQCLILLAWWFGDS